MLFIYPYLKYVIPVGTIGVIVIYVLMDHRPMPLFRGFLVAILLSLVTLSVLNYTNLGRWTNNRYLNAMDFFHYYTGSKYLRELGYNNSNPATLVADDLTTRKFTGSHIRDPKKKFGFIGVEEVLGRKAYYKGLFEDERWQMFVKDVEYFKTRLQSSQWNYILNRDIGYNGTPVWAVLGGMLSHIISTDNEWGMSFLALLDVFLFLAGVACVWRAFGHRTALLMVIFFGSFFITSHLHPKGAFLRTDWIMCLVMAICMLKLEHYKIAGALTAYAALSRIFPAIFIFGLGAKFVLELVQRRSVNRRYLAYFASFSATVCILVAASIVYSGGLEIWNEFGIKISKHNTVISPLRIGFKYVFIMSYKSGPPDGGLEKFFEQWRIIWWGIQALVLLISMFLVRKLEDYEATAYSFVLVFFLVATTYYYYIMLLVPFLFFATKLEVPARSWGLIMLFIFSMVSYHIHKMWGRNYFPQFFSISCMVMGFVLYMMAVALIESLKKDSLGPVQMSFADGEGQ